MFVILATLLFTHFAACCWLALIEDKENLLEESWLQSYMADFEGYPYSSATRMYLLSFYWGFSTISTVGLGDIHPSNAQETVFCLFFMVIGVWFYSNSIGTFTRVILGRSSVAKVKEFDVLAELQAHNRVPKTLLYKLSEEVEASFIKK